MASTNCGLEADDDAVAQLAELAGGDARHALGVLEVAAALARADTDASPPRLVLAHVEAALGTRAVRYGVDGHYDAISALIKSVRGSDPDAGLYWLAQMLEAGDDARFIARRLVILASEDVGMADPQGLVVASAAAHALELVGLPEAQLNLAHAVVYLATAPKSNRVTMAIGEAQEAVRSVATSGVPLHLRGAGFRGARSLGHGVGYRYPHDDPAGWVDQRYRPDEVADQHYYRPSRHGFEGRLADRWPPNRRLDDDDDDADDDGRRRGWRPWREAAPPTARSVAGGHGAGLDEARRRRHERPAGRRAMRIRRRRASPAAAGVASGTGRRERRRPGGGDRHDHRRGRHHRAGREAPWPCCGCCGRPAERSSRWRGTPPPCWPPCSGRPTRPRRSWPGSTACWTGPIGCRPRWRTPPGSPTLR